MPFSYYRNNRAGFVWGTTNIVVRLFRCTELIFSAKYEQSNEIAITILLRTQKVDSLWIPRVPVIWNVSGHIRWQLLHVFEIKWTLYCGILPIHIECNIECSLECSAHCRRVDRRCYILPQTFDISCHYATAKTRLPLATELHAAWDG